MNPHTTEPHAKGEFGEPSARPPGPGVWHTVRKVLKPIASLKLTVVLFVLGLLLIFFGTLAQLDFGIWTVVDKYFWSWVVWVPFDLLNKFGGVFWKDMFSSSEQWEGSFPLPGGKLLGLLMVINLLTAHFLLIGDAVVAAVRQSSREGALRRVLMGQLKRTGIYLIHGGLLILFAGECITRMHAIEQRMTIPEGQWVNFAEDARFVEFAVTDPSNPTTDRVVTIPENMLKKPGARITHPDLPVDIEVVGEFMINAELERPKPGQKNPGDSGLSKMWVAAKKPEVSGLDEQKTNLPAVYLKFLKKGTDQSLGTYLASLQFYLVGGEDEFEVDGKTYQAVLRFQRYYKPYRIYLEKFRFDRYTGTQKAKNFSSDVQLLDENGKVIIAHQHIAMNEPMRYNGETFYQQSFDKSEKTTILQVVKNPGWLLPYIACVVVGLGLLIHFLTALIRFLRRRTAPAAPVAQSASPEVSPSTTVATNLLFNLWAIPLGFVVFWRPGGATADEWTGKPSRVGRLLPVAVVAFVVLYLLSVGMRMAPPKQPFDYDAAARMRIFDGGRLKPLDTYARVQLRLISSREEAYDNDGKKMPAIRWYLDTIATGGLDQRGAAWDYKVIRIDNEQVLNELKLEKRDGYRYSMKELAPKIGILQGRMDALEQKVNEGKKLDTDETKFKELRDRIETYLNMTELGGPPPKYEGLLMIPPEGDKNWASLRKHRVEATTQSTLAAMAKVRQKIAPKLKDFKKEDEDLLLTRLGMEPTKLTDMQRINASKRLRELLTADAMEIGPKMHRVWLDTALLLLPEAEQKEIRDSMQADAQKRMDSRPAAAVWDRLITAYREGRANDFSREVDEYNKLVEAGNVPDVTPPKSTLEKILYAPFNAFGHNRVEITFNRFAPFYQCAGLYVLAFLLALAGFIMVVAGQPNWSLAFRRSAFALLVLTFVIHTAALFARMYLMERPLVFVTNLYSSAIFIGLGCVGLCLAIELIFRIGVGSALAAMLGLATTIVAHNLATEDTLEMMQAVLDTNFWLATHVTTVTLGYTATFVAGFLGALYVLQMLGAVVRDSFAKVGEPTVGELLAFSTAVLGIVGIPVFFLWFMTNAANKFELAPPVFLWALFGLVAASALIYALALMLLRVGSPGVDAHGKPTPGQTPAIAQPVTALALTPESAKIFGQMVYGVVCFATLLSFVGTVLGGIWADQSWGRFWGWDPKENGAVLIVLWNSLILHARWAGLVKDRGVAVLAIFGNCITAWSWFGTNQLSIGLHAYGFDSRLADGCFNFWMSQLLILGLGLIPQQFWASVSRRSAVSAASAAPPVGAAPATGMQPPGPSTDASANGSANGTPHTNGHPNGQPNGHPRRDKKKRHGKK